jgi:hypothetical protein
MHTLMHKLMRVHVFCYCWAYTVAKRYLYSNQITSVASGAFSGLRSLLNL